MGQGKALPFPQKLSYMFFSKKAIPTFTSRSAAFNFMFAEQMGNGVDALEAAERAAKFADIIATNMALPSAPPKPTNGLDACIGYVKQIAQLKKDHPEVWELITGAAGGLISSFAVLTSTSPTPPTGEVCEKINFEELK